MTGRTGSIHGAISDHAIRTWTEPGEVATAAGDFRVGSFKGKPRFLMVELRDLVFFRSVTIPAVFLGKLLPVWSVVFMAGRTRPLPPGLVQFHVIESVH